MSIMLWVYVHGLDVTTRQREFAVKAEARNVPEGLVLTSVLPEIRITAEAPNEVLDSIILDEIVAYVDFAEGESGSRDYPVIVSWPSRYRAAFRYSPIEVVGVLEETSQASMTVTVEKLGSIDPTNKLILGDVTAVPDSVRLTGPTSEILKVKKVRALLDLSKVRSSAGVPVDLEVLGDRDTVLSMVSVEPRTVMVMPAVSPAPDVKNVLINPTFIGEPAFGHRVVSYRVEPIQLPVTGRPDALSQVFALQTDPIDLAGMTGTKTWTIGVRIPNGLRLTQARSVKVTVITEKVEAAPPPQSGATTGGAGDGGP